MSVAASQPLNILQGDAFGQRLAVVCRDGLPPITPWADVNYRNVLIPHLVGGELPYALHGMIGQALRIRGVNVTALICDSFLPACVCRKVDHHESACTRWCHRNAVPFAEALGLPYRTHSSFLTADDLAACDREAAAVADADLASFTWQDCDYGALITQSVESFFRVGRYDPDDPAMVTAARDFLHSALYVTLIAERAIDELHVDKIVTDCGFQVEWGVFRAVAGRRGIPVDVINVGLRGTALKVTADRPGHPPQQVPGWDQWRDQPLTAEQETALDTYLRRREKVPYEFKDERWQGRISDTDEVHRLVGLPTHVRGKTFAMYPNVGFDAGKTKTAPAFDQAADWVVQTIAWFRNRPEDHLVVKIHPGERHRAARDPVDALIRARCAPLPDNVHVIAADSGITAHSVLRLADAALVYTSTVAAEAVGLDIPVVLAGGGRHAGHGVTCDVPSAAAYFDLLADFCGGAPCLPRPGELGRRYAYAVFFRADIPIDHFRMLDIYVADVAIDSLADLAPGRNRYIDAVCRGALYDDPYANPDTVDASLPVDHDLAAASAS